MSAPDTLPTSGTRNRVRTFQRQVRRFLVGLTEKDEDGEPQYFCLSLHHYKKAALIAYEVAKRTWQDRSAADWHCVELFYWDAEENKAEWISPRDWHIWPKRLRGECEKCQTRETQCESRKNNGQCRYTLTGNWFTYALHDPRTGEIRYIGMSEQEPEMRLRQHINGAQGNPNGKKNQWIHELKKVRLKPDIRIITRWDKKQEAAQHERELIKKLPNLTNGQ